MKWKSRLKVRLQKNTDIWCVLCAYFTNRDILPMRYRLTLAYSILIINVNFIFIFNLFSLQTTIVLNLYQNLNIFLFRPMFKVYFPIFDQIIIINFIHFLLTEQLFSILFIFDLKCPLLFDTTIF